MFVAQALTELITVQVTVQFNTRSVVHALLLQHLQALYRRDSCRKYT